MWLGVAWDVIKSYLTDALLYWRRRRLLPSTPFSDWVRDENRQWPAHSNLCAGGPPGSCRCIGHADKRHLSP